MRRFRVTIVAVEKQEVLNILSVCLYSCLSNPACKIPRRTVLLSVACLAVQYLSTLSHQQHDFRNEVTERQSCVLIISTIFV
jgi:hypothetical protein